MSDGFSYYWTDYSRQRARHVRYTHEYPGKPWSHFDAADLIPSQIKRRGSTGNGDKSYCKQSDAAKITSK